MTTLVLSHPHDGKEPGAKIDVEPGEANYLVQAGVALYATIAEAKKVGGDPEDAASKRT